MAEKKLLRKANVKMDPRSKEIMEKGNAHVSKKDTKAENPKTEKAMKMLMGMKKIAYKGK